MTLLILAFFAWVLTVLAPCVLPLLPVVLGTSLEGKERRYAPFFVILWLSISILVFSLLLKASTLLIDIHPNTWKYLSWGILIFLGLIYIFPDLWKKITSGVRLNSKSSELLQKADTQTWTFKYLLLWAALWPVFSSCSPTYLIILAIILPVSFFVGLSALFAYILGLAFVLCLIAIFGQKFATKLQFLNGKNVSKFLWILFLIIGLAIISGYDKKIETWLVSKDILNFTEFEQNLTKQLDLEKFENIQNQNQDIETQYPYQLEGINYDEEIYGCEDGWKCIKIDAEVSGSIVWSLAPRIEWVGEWRNGEISDMKDLEWSVVLVKFFSSSCINCIRSHTDTNSLYENFNSEHFDIIWFHSPEFAYEKNIEVLEESILNHDIRYPVAQDNDFIMFRAYKNRYWPAYFLIDRDGVVRYEFFWNGNTEVLEEKITELLL